MILLPLTLAAVTAGCSTFSDSDAVARVNGVELTSDEFDAKLTELGVTGDEVVPLDPSAPSSAGGSSNSSSPPTRSPPSTTPVPPRPEWSASGPSW